MDFVILDTEEDIEIVFILEWSFMKTTKVIINVGDEKLKVKDGEVTFNVFEVE